MGAKVIWSNPPHTGGQGNRPRTDWFDECAGELRAHPTAWGRVRTETKDDASNVRQLLKKRYPGYEFSIGKVEGEADERGIWARYVGVGSRGGEPGDADEDLDDGTAV